MLFGLPGIIGTFQKNFDVLLKKPMVFKTPILDFYFLMESIICQIIHFVSGSFTNFKKGMVEV